MVTVRKATDDDTSVIREIAYEVWPIAYETILTPEQLDFMLQKFYDTESLLHQINVLHHRFIIAEDNDKNPVGFASYAPHTDDDKIFHLHKIYVRVTNQKLHVGRNLLEYIFNHLHSMKARALQLNVNRHNSAIQFYQKMGFEIIRSEDIDIGKGYFMNDFVMEKKITTSTAE